jgi:hypothetical protein
MAEGHHSEGLPDDAHNDFDGGERELVHILAVRDVGGAAKPYPTTSSMESILDQRHADPSPSVVR